MAVIPVQTGVSPSGELHPRQHQITVVGPGGATSFATDGRTYLVFTPELALQCELAGIDFVFVNLSQVLALGVGFSASSEGPVPEAAAEPEPVPNGVVEPEGHD